MTEIERLDRMHCTGHPGEPFQTMVCRDCAANQIRLAVGEERSKIIEELKSGGFEEAAKSLESAIVPSGPVA